MWDKVSAADLERAKRVLATRRSEMLARHAEELKALETDQAEIDAIENAIAAFTQKFKPAQRQKSFRSTPNGCRFKVGNG